MTTSNLERFALLMINAAGLPQPEKEYRFHPTRKWRFDFAYPAQKIAIEIEGAVWFAGRHTRGSGFLADCEKYNTAVSLGWKVFRFGVKDRQIFPDLAATLKPIFSEDKNETLHKLQN